jgi:DNA polymerase-3 subunit delta
VPDFLAVISGKDEFLVEEDALKLYREAIKKAGSDADTQIISAQITRVEDALQIEREFSEAVATLSMFGGKKVVWLRNLNWMSGSKQADSADVKESLKHMLELVAKSNDMVSIIISAAPLDGRRKDLQVLKPIADQFITHTFEKPKPWENQSEQTIMQIARATALFKKLGTKFEPDVPEVLVGRVGQSTRMVLTEVEKLAIYVGPGGTVKARDVLFIVPPFGEGEFFEPIEAFAARDLNWALEALDRYFFNESSCRPLIAALHNRLRLLIQVRSLADSGDFKLTSSGITKPQFEVAITRHGPTFGSATKSSANIFSQNTWYLTTQVAPGAFHYSLSELIDLQLACTECFDISNSGGDDEVALRALFLRALAVRR